MINWNDEEARPKYPWNVVDETATTPGNTQVTRPTEPPANGPTTTGPTTTNPWDGEEGTAGIPRIPQGPTTYRPVPEPVPYFITPYGGKAPTLDPSSPFAFGPRKPSQPFQWKTFQPPSPDSIYSDPSYKFRLGEGERSLEASAAARGTLNSGMTLKDILGYGQNFASQEYQNIFNRAMATDKQQFGEAYQTWQGNDQADFRDWDANRGLALETHDRAVSDALDKFHSGWDVFSNAQGQWDKYQTNTQTQLNNASDKARQDAKDYNDWVARILGGAAA